MSRFTFASIQAVVIAITSVNTFAQTPTTPDPATPPPAQKVLHGNLCRTGVPGCDKLLVIGKEDVKYLVTIWRADYDLTGASAKVVDKGGAEVDKLPVAIVDNSSKNRLSLSIEVKNDASEGTFYIQPDGLDDTEVSFTVKSEATVKAEERERKINNAAATAAAASKAAADLKTELASTKAAQTALAKEVETLKTQLAAAATKSDLAIVAAATKDTDNKLPKIVSDLQATTNKANDAVASVLSLDTRVAGVEGSQTRLAGLIARLGQTTVVEKGGLFRKEKVYMTNSEVAKEAANFMREHPLPPTAVATNK